MKSIVLLLFICVVAVSAGATDYELFTQFIADYDKTYKTTAEWDTRFSIFQTNLKKIDQLNSQSNGGAVHGISKFADMTAEEFSQYVIIFFFLQLFVLLLLLLLLLFILHFYIYLLKKKNTLLWVLTFFTY